MSKVNTSPRKKGLGKADEYAPDGPGARPSKGPKMSSGGIEEGKHHTGGTHAFQGELGRVPMPGAPGGSRSRQSE